MSSLEPRRSGGMSRSQKEQRAYRLVVIGGTSAAVAVVGLILAVAGVIGSGIPLVALVVAVLCAVLFRQVVASGRR